MGATYTLRQFPDDAIDRFQSNPQYYVGLQLSLEDLPIVESPGFFGRLLGARETVLADVPPPELVSAGGDEEDLGSTWHALHYMISGQEWGGELPGAFLLSYSETIHTAYDPGMNVQVLRSNVIGMVNGLLHDFTREKFRGRFNAEEMTRLGISPQIWDRTESLEWLTDAFESLKAFVARTAAARLGIITHWS